MLLRSNYEDIATLKEVLIGQPIESVTYRQTERGGLLDIPVEACHEVDLDVVLRIPSGAIHFTWERDGLIEGLSAALVTKVPSTTDGIINVDVSRSPQWHRLLGEQVSSVDYIWHVSEAGCPESLWSVRLTLDSGASVVIALGEIGGNSRPTYYPDALLVIFDENAARCYTQPGATGSAWASGI